MRSLLILGGARSGKSRYGQARIESLAGPLTYIATAQAFDAEMADRIARHQADRGPRWRTVEAPLDLPGAIAAVQDGAVLVDCLTLWVSNLLLADRDGDAAGEALCAALVRCRVPVALIANEVGLGIVPDNALARRFRDAAGWLNQRLATVADEVVFVAAGLPLVLKPA
ncbi:bifunctional adenosylcobinamide kinase/adenosylcobinamide-phosphate guanylyltransferase [Novosphingobium sp. KACC 22771]|uniref:bifunctional adenosylcobinamide kinase/adenosylcobinamide-phosphate guanylyltransferase n=1 Tax=Novosphingobium sp. KACC 22771 TaxID=3025670 RepID=UPI002365E656|nr:bifunctional adenosylcobinamide kinase/adenosylcobinamide-phosphate guanylyltransferase [Novosphingobium sp. KACC 22771]WDF74786.1 bifunctional adenosylcobinamide kinase/adenosylcobinamide-phosphate guanylyltransferase [Novosphingobium sp. KACC 22771]